MILDTVSFVIVNIPNSFLTWNLIRLFRNPILVQIQLARLDYNTKISSEKTDMAEEKNEIALVHSSSSLINGRLKKLPTFL